jgi:glucokinase
VTTADHGVAVERTCVALDIGGTKIAAATVTATGAVLTRASAATPRTGATAVLAAAAELVSTVSGGSSPAVLGVGSPGVVDATSGTVRSASDVLPGWAGTRVVAELRQRCGCPVVVDNDVRAMAVGEARHGAGRTYADALYVAVGTGIGGAIWRAGQLWRGPHATAGEIAHLLVPTVGAAVCGCGRRDHIEAIASGPAIESAYAVRAGTRLGLGAIGELMREGDELAAGVVADAARLLGRTIAGFVSALDVEAVVVGGGVSELGDDFLSPLREALRAEVLPPLRGIAVLRAQLGSDAPLVGAAMLAFDQLRGSPTAAASAP